MSSLKFALLFIVLVLLQVLILNHIFFLGYATPFLYIYFLIKLPVSMSRNLVIFLGFILGLTIDIFCNTPGLNAAATTFAAFMRYPIQKLFFTKEEFDHTESNISKQGSSFVKYAIVLILIHHIALISLEYFSYFNIQTILIRILASSLLTSIIIFVIESLSTKRDRG